MPDFLEVIRGERESKSLDFKEQIDLDSDVGKAKFLDDVVAFANSAGGMIIVGVKDKKGQFFDWNPQQIEDEDKVRLKLLSVVETGVSPKLLLKVDFHVVGNGLIIAVHVPSGLQPPYFNKKNGSFYERGDGRNVVMSREDIRSRFASEEAYAAKVDKMLRTQRKEVRVRNLVEADGSRLELIIVPRESFQGGRTRFEVNEKRGTLRTFPSFNDRYGRRPCVFKDCNEGFEARSVDFDGTPAESRFFLGDDWSVCVTAAYPITMRRDGYPDIPEFKATLRSYMKEVFDLYETEGIQGPFAGVASIGKLHEEAKMKHFFPRGDSVLVPIPLGDRDAFCTSLEKFMDRVSGISRFGR